MSIEGVALRTLLVAGLPLAVAAVSGDGGEPLQRTLAGAGLRPLPAFLGHELPRGARVGFQVDTSELKLFDEREGLLLRAPRSGLDPDWVQSATQLRGTMTVVLTGDAPSPDLGPRELAQLVDERARAGEAIGAIVGVAEERPTLPLLF